MQADGQVPTVRRVAQEAALNDPGVAAGLRSEAQGTTLRVVLVGEWRATQVPALESQLAALSLDGVREVAVHTSDATALDLSGAWHEIPEATAVVIRPGGELQRMAFTPRAPEA